MQKSCKHIETKFNFIRDKTEDGTFSFRYIPTDKMAAKIFAKSLPVLKAEEFRTALMETDFQQKQEQSLLFCGSRDKESPLHLGPR